MVGFMYLVITHTPGESYLLSVIQVSDAVFM